MFFEGQKVEKRRYSPGVGDVSYGVFTVLRVTARFVHLSNGETYMTKNGVIRGATKVRGCGTALDFFIKGA